MEKKIWRGLCMGGPWDKREGESRFPSGFVLVDRINRRAWIYDMKRTRFHVRDEAGMPLDDEKRWQAAESAEWDVRAQ